MHRVAIVGQSGSGKSTLAHRLADRIGAEVIDLDTLFHGPDWTPSPTPEFRARVAASLDAPSWVAAGNYTTVMDLVHGAADTIVWLDLPRWRSTARVVKRSVRRVATREELWNGNRERWRNLVSRDPERNVILWSWRSHPQISERFSRFADGKFWAHADVRRLRRPADVDAFLQHAEG